MIRNGVKTLKLATLCTLPIAGMQSRYFVILSGNGCRDAAIHSTAHQNHGFGSTEILVHLGSILGRQKLGF
jgi:hypothetical protein